LNKIPAKSGHYFIADLHLAENRPDITACFLSFLGTEAKQARSLYILGDLFEYWIGDDNRSVFTDTIAAGISALANSGVKVFFIHGNRDFLLGEKYAKQAGMTILPELEVIHLYHQKMLIMHGDTLCTRDLGYQAFRKKSRSWWWQAIVKSLPLFVRRNMAENYRKQSASATALKAPDIMDVTPSEVVKVLEQQHCQLLIHGHTHRPDIHKIQANNLPAQRVVLGDWYEQGSYLLVDESGVQLINKAFNDSP
jgi:UDP-2,3-diacylglucosamine hydrolase